MKRFLTAVVVTFVAGLMFANVRAADDKKEMTIKDAMKLHKDKLNEKFIKGEATKEEKKKLQDAYEAMSKIKPPKGDEKDWKEKCEALVKALKDDDKKAYEKAVNCKACHDAHKK